MTRKSVLFVDDEANILRGLRRMLHGRRGDWEMAFAEGGAAALALFERQRFDVVVTDMRMPGMDGAQLLSQIRARAPDTVRIILSGYAEEEAVLKTVGPAHQYLAKPCDAAALAATIDRALVLRGYLDRAELRALVAGIETLPSPPDIYLKLVAALESTSSNAETVAAILGADVAMTAETLKLTNSAYFALPQRITAVRQAVALLGFETIKALTLVVGFFRQFDGPPEIAARIDTLAQRSLQIGTLARAIAMEEGLAPEQADLASSAGVLAHVGSLVFMSTWPDRFAVAVAEVEAGAGDIVTAERRILGAAHTEMGAYLLGLWGFADPVVEAVAYHHEPSRCPQVQMGVLSALYAAQHLLRVVDRDQDGTEAVGGGIDQDYLAAIGCADRLARWHDIAAATVKNGGGP